MVLAPLLYPEKRDILMDRILPDSGGIAKTMMESSLADFMQEVGYGFCARFVETCYFQACNFGGWWFSFLFLEVKGKEHFTEISTILSSIIRLFI